MLPNWHGSGTGAGLRFDLLGIPVRVHPTFLFLAAVVGLSIGDQLGAVTAAAVLFLTILGHELGHAAVAQAFGAAPSIELHGLGGHTRVPLGFVESRFQLVLLSLSGPAAGAAVGAAGWVAGRHLDGTAGLAADLSWWFGVVLGVANLLPVRPLDGGLALTQLLRGDEDRRLRTARIVSVTAGAAVAVLAWTAGYGIAAALVGWFAAGNLVELLRGGIGRNRSTQLDAQLVKAWHELHPASAPEVEELASRALGVAPEGHRGFPASVLVASLLFQRRVEDARALAGALERDDVAPVLRDLALLGDGAAEELDRRLSGRPTDGDFDLLLVQRAFAQDWSSAVALAEADDQGRLHVRWVEVVAQWAFFAGAFEASARLGQAVERRDAAMNTSYNIACSWARLDQADRAVEALGRAMERGWNDVRKLDTDPDLETARRHPA